MKKAAVVASLLVLLSCLVLVAPAAAKESETPFEILPGSFQMTPSTLQAGAHEDLTTSFDFTHTAAGQTFNDPKDTVVSLPAGYDASNTAVPTCSISQLVGSIGGRSECPADSQVGTIILELTFPGSTHATRGVMFPVYNMEVTSFGVTAQLGFNAFIFAQILTVSVRPGDSGLTVTAPDVVNVSEPHGVSVTVWGVPASHEHDPQRGMVCLPQPFTALVATCEGGGESVNIPHRPFLSTPTSCTPTTATLQADSWEQPGRLLADGTPDLSDASWQQASSEIPSTGECDRVPFDPSVEVRPTTNAAESPSGLNVSLLVPQVGWEQPETIATANLKKTVLALPVGFTINPSSGSGLGVCSPQQLAAETAGGPPGSGCPEESKIGSVEVETPALAEKLGGAVYVAAPFDNPFNSLLALYVTVKSPERGIIVKLAGHVELDPVTGQVTTTFDNNPQVPFNRFTLKLRQGATSPLVSPPACGSYSAQASLSPWSAPESALLVDSPSFTIEHGIGGGPCPPGGVPLFKPGIVAGTLNNSAGSYSQLDIRISRNDGEQEITRFSSLFPPGLSAKLSGVPFCSDAAIEEAKHTSGARQETEPSCSAATYIGHSLVGAGVGGVLAWTPGRVYMAGPYNGAPFSIVAITSAKVGPFDLGTVVVREALKIDPITAAVTVDARVSDPIPHIIQGIVIHVRDIRVYVDRPQFMLNPTSCDPMSLAATVDGAGADFTNPADQVPVTITSPFQLANCQNLAFKPGFQVSTSGRTSKANGASLNVKLTYPNAPQGTQANIARVKVDLPKQLPSRLTTLQKGCTAAQFNTNPAGCPAASVVGHARAITPILPVPLEGPAYFVSHGGEAFPSLIIVLQGYGVTIDLVGSTFISKAGITSSTFKAVPDQPVTSFELTLPQGRYSALTANGNLCKSKLAMPTEFVAQNGATIHQSTKVGVTGCPKSKKAKKRVKHRNGHAGHGGKKGSRGKR
ncbi:MAG TPA: hypothetical protein VNY27_03130 [Solirubrobacteraceae bacterium]|jgi:hypothetical protein|nr:hypothetical protein [Solirubrobacteraceae bacterium]